MVSLSQTKNAQYPVMHDTKNIEHNCVDEWSEAIVLDDAVSRRDKKVDFYTSEALEYGEVQTYVSLPSVRYLS